MKLVGAMHAATVMAARNAATVVHKVVRNAKSKATLLRLFAKTNMRKEGMFSFLWRVEFKIRCSVISPPLCRSQAVVCVKHKRRVYRLVLQTSIYCLFQAK